MPYDVLEQQADKVEGRVRRGQEEAARGDLGEAQGVRAQLKQLDYQAGTEAVSPTAEAGHRVARAGVEGPGHALPHQQTAERALGTSLDGVRAHTGPDAQAACGALGAKAYAYGRDVAFADASPDAPTVAHEATHTVQQAGGGPTIQKKDGATTFKSGDPRGKIASLHPLMQAKARQLVTEANKRGLNVWVFEAMRSVARQNELYAQGRTKPGNKVTWVKGGGSYHNYGLAIDVIFHSKQPWGEQHDWNKLGEAGEAAGLEWGGRWKNSDRPHFQMPGFKISTLKGWLANGGMKNVWANVSGGGGSTTETSKPTEDAEASGDTKDTGGGTYTVKSGDTLGKIAKAQLGDASRWRDIAKANGNLDPRKLRIGQVLVIPGGSGSTPTTTTKPETEKPKTETKKEDSDTGKNPVATIKSHKVTDGKAIIRSGGPNFKSTGKVIPKGEMVSIIATEKDSRGRTYVQVQQVMPEGVYGPPMLWGWTLRSNLEGFSSTPTTSSKTPVRTEGDDATLAATDKIDLTGLSGTDKSMARIYNSKGAYLKEAATRLGIDAASAAAVLKVESGGAGFRDGKMIIRFENHVFYSRWGKSNATSFANHFKYNSGKKWTGHKWRSSASGAWEDFHGSQAKEWAVFEFARGLDEAAAIKSISMGIAQLMGFNYSMLGYSSPREMFDHMKGGLRPQLDGMFTFIQNKKICIQGLKAKDYVKFATGYNGSGQAQAYGTKIANYAAAYARVAAGKKHA